MIKIPTQRGKMHISGENVNFPTIFSHFHSRKKITNFPHLPVFPNKKYPWSAFFQLGYLIIVVLPFSSFHIFLYMEPTTHNKPLISNFATNHLGRVWDKSFIVYYVQSRQDTDTGYCVICIGNVTITLQVKFW